MRDPVRQDYEESIRRLERKVFDFFTLSQLGKALISIQDMENLAHVFVSSVYEATNARSIALLIHDPENNRYTYQYSIGLDKTKVKGTSFAEEEGLFRQVLNGGEPFAIRDSAGDYRFERVVERFNLYVLDSELWVPLMVKNILRGVLTLGLKKSGKPYDDREITFISHLASQGAVALDSAIIDREKVRATDALGRKVENLSILYDVSKALNFTNDLKKTLLLILDKSRNAVDAEKGSIMLLNQDTSELEVKVVRGIDPISEQKINNGDYECTNLKVGEGIAGKVAQTGRYMVVQDASRNHQFKKSVGSNVENIVCVPLICEDECIGVMNVTNKKSGGRFTPDDIKLLLTLAGQASVTINNANLYHLAITDGLTQLYINRYFRQKLQDEIRRSRRFGHCVSLLLVDIDHFKRFNDEHGHQQGDLVLVQVAKLFKELIRETDLACRYGGEEFVAVLPETDTEDASKLADRLRTAIAAHRFVGIKGGELVVTVSIGVSTFPNHGEDERSLIRSADLALYSAKEAGRDRVVVYGPDLKEVLA